MKDVLPSVFQMAKVKPNLRNTVCVYQLAPKKHLCIFFHFCYTAGPKGIKIAGLGKCNYKHCIAQPKFAQKVVYNEI